jgi:hypothetical protein
MLIGMLGKRLGELEEIQHAVMYLDQSDWALAQRIDQAAREAFVLAQQHGQRRVDALILAALETARLVEM